MIHNREEHAKTTKRLIRNIMKPNVWFVERVESTMNRAAGSSVVVWISKTRGITTEPIKAKQFEAKEDAQYYIKHNNLAPDWIPTEHEFIEP